MKKQDGSASRTLKITLRVVTCYEYLFEFARYSSAISMINCLGWSKRVASRELCLECPASGTVYCYLTCAQYSRSEYLM